MYDNAEIAKRLNNRKYDVGLCAFRLVGDIASFKQCNHHIALVDTRFAIHIIIGLPVGRKGCYEFTIPVNAVTINKRSFVGPCNPYSIAVWQRQQLYGRICYFGVFDGNVHWIRNHDLIVLLQDCPDCVHVLLIRYACTVSKREFTVGR